MEINSPSPPQWRGKKKLKIPTHIINTSHFRRCKFGVVASTTGRVYPSTCDPLLQYGIFNGKVEHFVNFSSLLLEHLIKLCIQFKETYKRSAWRIYIEAKVEGTGKWSLHDNEKRQTFSAWTTVLGKPSKMKPFWHDGFFIASSIIPTTKSSETSSPCQANKLTSINRDTLKLVFK